MKKSVFFLMMMVPLLAKAYDFSLVVPSGQTLYFNYVTGGVEVTYPNSNGSPVNNAWAGYEKPTGAIVIPSTVSCQGIEYQVVSISAFAFYNCGYHISVTIPEGVTSLGNSAFCYNTAMTTVSIPASVTSVGSQTFGFCNSLADVWIYAQVPPTTASGAFYNTTLTGATLHVPCNSDSVYAVSVPWSGFGSIDASQCMVTFTTGVNNSLHGTVTGGGSYAHGTNVTLAALPTDGFAFICWQDGDTLNPRIVTALHDSTFIAMFFALRHDTVVSHEVEYIHDTVVVHDTVTVTMERVDTLWRHDTLTVYDTVRLTDTVMPTFYQLQVLSDNGGLGVGVGSSVLPAGTLAEVCALPLEGGRFVSWSDGNRDNPRQVTVTCDMVLTAQFELLGIHHVEKQPWTLSVDGRRLTVTGVAGCSTRLYDAMGRLLHSVLPTEDNVMFQLPAAGVFVVRVGDWGAKKIVAE